MESEPNTQAEDTPTLNDILELGRRVDLKGRGDNVHRLRAWMACARTEFDSMSKDDTAKDRLLNLVRAIRAELSR